MEKESNKNQTDNYQFNLLANDTFWIKMDGMEKLFNEKISALGRRIATIENGELRRQDRAFKWKTNLASVVLGAILGIVGTLIKLKIIN